MLTFAVGHSSTLRPAPRNAQTPVLARLLRSRAPVKGEPIDLSGPLVETLAVDPAVVVIGLDGSGACIDGRRPVGHDLRRASGYRLVLGLVHPPDDPFHPTTLAQRAKVGPDAWTALGAIAELEALSEKAGGCLHRFTASRLNSSEKRLRDLVMPIS